MATIGKMMLCGLRSFGPYEEDLQKVKFSSPLTLFLGKNGCGKTTIIEALKFACSGDIPGGTKGGQGFVNDPKLTATVSTKGQVRLEFTDAKGNQYLVIKSVQVTNKGNTSSFKRLDTTLKRINPDGTSQAISSRCADVDTDICEILGVSKAILNNVIFCHQEDAAWPLEEPKKLKEKFDEIFGATEYNKCSESLRKIVKERVTNNKIQQEKVLGLKQAKEFVEKKRSEMQEKEEKLTKFEEVIKEKEAQREPINTRLQEICDLEINLGKLQESFTKKEMIKKGIVERQNEILKSITVEHTGSDEELQREIASFEINRGKSEEKLKALEKEKSNVEGQKDQLSTSIGRTQIKMGKLQGEKNQHQKTVTERNGMIQQTSKSLNISVPSTLDSNSDVVSAITAIKKALETSKSSLSNLTQECDGEESQLQETINTSRDKLAKTKHSIDSKNQQIQELKGKTRDINSQIRDLDYSDEQLKSLQSKISRIDGDLKNCKSLFDSDAVSKSINDDKQKMRQHEEKLEKLEREYKILQQNSITDAELENQRHELVKQESEIHKLKNKHFDILTKIFNEDIPEPGFIKRSVETRKEINSDKIKDMKKQITSKQKETSTLEGKCKYQKMTLQSLEKELEKNEKQVIEVCKGKSFDVMSNELHQAVEKLQRDKGQYNSAKIMYDKFLQDFQAQKPCCPICKTDFENKQAAVRDIVNTIRNKIQGIPQELERVKKELELKQAQHNKLMQLKPISDKVQELKLTLIPKSRSDLSDFENFYKRVSKELNDLTEQIIEPQSIVDTCNEVVGDAALIDHHQLEISRAERKIAELELQLLQVPSNRSRQQTEAEIEDLKVDISNTRRNYEASQKKLQQHNDRCQELREERSKHIEKQLQLQKAMQGKPQLQDQLVELTEKEQTLKTEIGELQIQLNPLKTELDAAEKAKEIARTVNRKKLAETQTKLNDNQKMFGDINKLQNSVNAYVTRDGDGAFEAALQELTKFKEKLGNLEEGSKKILNSITEVNKQLVNQDSAFRTLNDNLTLRQKRVEEQVLSEEIANLKSRIGSHNYRTILAEKKRLQEQGNDLAKEINQVTGRSDELKQDIKKARTELNSPGNKQVYANYKKAFIELTCSKKVVQDLELYIKALEFGILKFHQERMSQINKIIRHLWSSIYRGNDCDYIQIKTDETKTTAARRAYNYKVVQMKANVELDMRGRCSAGQKVLACLIIRMALAETFSKNCGILALDEPTTNLDSENIAALSNALARIVNARQLEKNFQLLIITHDEEFLSTLTRVDKVSHYWKVSRNEKGNSVVRKERI